MPSLIHLNGPPGVGKSTLAQRYADEHPGVLDLDIDMVASLVGGWRDDFYGALPAARTLALAMIKAHLSGDRDVVMPQLVMRETEAERFRLAAVRAGGDYVEIALGVGPVEQVARFAGKAAATEVTAQVARVVAAGGGDDLHADLRERLATYLGGRPVARRLDTSGLDVDTSYARLLELLGSR